MFVRCNFISFNVDLSLKYLKQLQTSLQAGDIISHIVSSFVAYKKLFQFRLYELNQSTCIVNNVGKNVKYKVRSASQFIDGNRSLDGRT